MIPIEKLRAVQRVITHADCPDGTASAMILRDALPRAEFAFCEYGSAALAQLEPRPGDLFCDFTPPDDRAGEWRSLGAIVLDHHASRRELVESFGDLGVYADEPGVSGAVLAYREVWSPLRRSDAAFTDQNIVRELAILAGVRDTWQKSSSDWPAACAQAEGLNLWPVEHLLTLAPDEWHRYLVSGHVVVARNRDRDFHAKATSVRTAKAVYLQLAVDKAESSRQVSDVADLCAGTCDVVAGFAYFCEGFQPRLRVSLRAVSPSFDVSAIAKKYGGGGHRAAAGFVVDAPKGENPYEFLRRVVEGGGQ